MDKHPFLTFLAFAIATVGISVGVSVTATNSDTTPVKADEKANIMKLDFGDEADDVYVRCWNNLLIFVTSGDKQATSSLAIVEKACK